MKETTFTAALAQINFPPHEATFQAAIRGWPTKENAMNAEEAMRIAQMAMWHALLRRWKKFDHDRRDPASPEYDMVKP